MGDDDALGVVWMDEVDVRGRLELLGRQAEQAFDLRARVHGVPAGGVELVGLVDVDGERKLLDERLVALLCVAQLGHVAERDRVALAPVERRDRDRGVEELARATHELALEVPDRLAASEHPCDAPEVAGTVAREQLPDVLADLVVGRGAGQLLGRRVPARHAVLGVDREDRVARGCDDRRETSPFDVERLALDEVAELHGERPGDFDERAVLRQRTVGEQLEDGDHLAVGDDRKRERGLQPVGAGGTGAREGLAA